MKIIKSYLKLLPGALLLLTMLVVPHFRSLALDNPQSGSVGLQGKIGAPPPTTAPTITVPKEGQSFTSLPITVSGLCSGDLLIKIFKNNVFAGSAQCQNGSYSLQIDLFIGANQLIARGYDALDQASPDSVAVNVTFNDSHPGAGSRVTLTSNYAKRGVASGQTLTWPIILSGGEGPYAISVDWGDGKPADLKSLSFSGAFDIQHIYDNPGIYNIIVKATDKNGSSAFLQLVGLANGPVTQSNTGSNPSTTLKIRVLWEPAAIAIPLLIFTFWLGRRYERHLIRDKIERGERPF